MENNLFNTDNKPSEFIEKKAILVVSFGSSIEEARNKAIVPIEELIASQFSDYTFARGYTSNFIRRKLAKQGIFIDSAHEALEKLIQQGYQEIYIQPLHILAGFEFEKIQDAVNALAKPNIKIRLGLPLMTTEKDLEPIADALTHQEELTVYIGHGTEHPINHMYEKLEEKLMAKGGSTFVGTVEEGPIPMLERFSKLFDFINNDTHKTKIHLKPFLLVAGDHVLNDINGKEESSWLKSFEANGYKVQTDLRGLGEIYEFQQLFLNRVKVLIEKG